MDVIGGLTAAKLALDLAKDLRGIDRSVDEAGYKMKLAELMSALADTQIAFADAKTKIADLENELKAAKDGDLCPKCRTGRLEITEVRSHDVFASLQFHDSHCNNGACSYSNTRLYNADFGSYGKQT